MAKTYNIDSDRICDLRRMAERLSEDGWNYYDGDDLRTELEDENDNPEHRNGVRDGLSAWTDEVESVEKPEDKLICSTLNGIPVYEMQFYCESQIECEKIFARFRKAENLAELIMKGARV